jgi:hypothetical protein
MVPPHLLKRILQKIEARKAKGEKTAKVQPDPWTAIDQLEAARP